MIYYVFIIGRRWANQYGRGVRHDQLISKSKKPTLPKGFTIHSSPIGYFKRVRGKIVAWK